MEGGEGSKRKADSLHEGGSKRRALKSGKGRIPEEEEENVASPLDAMFLRLMEYKEQKLKAEQKHDAVFEREQALAVRVSELESVYGRLVTALTTHYDLSNISAEPTALPSLLEHLRGKLGSSLSTPLDKTVAQQIGQLEEQNSRLAAEVARARPLEKENMALRNELLEAQELVDRYKRKVTKYQLGFQMVPQAQAATNGAVGRSTDQPDPSPGADGPAAGNPSAGGAEVSPTESNEDLEDERTRSALRLKEIERLQEDNRKLLATIEELRQREAEVTPERVKSSFVYTALNHQLNATTAETERLRTELSHCQSLLQKIKADHAEAERKVSEFVSKQAENFSKQLSDIQNKIKAAEKAKIDARQDLELLKTTLPSVEYVNELKKQAEISATRLKLLTEDLAKEREKNKSLSPEGGEDEAKQRTSQLVDEVAELTAAGKVKDSRLQEAEEKLHSQEIQIRKWRAKIALANVAAGRPAGDGADEQEESLPADPTVADQALVIAKDRLAHLEQEHSELQKKLAGQQLEFDNLQKAALRNQSKAERSVKELQGLIVSRQKEAEGLMSEIEVIGQAFEELQTQNNRLLEQLGSKDEATRQVMAQGIKMNQAKAMLEKERQLLLEKCKLLETKLKAVEGAQATAEEQVKQQASLVTKLKTQLQAGEAVIQQQQKQSDDTMRQLEELRSNSKAVEERVSQVNKRLTEQTLTIDKERAVIARLKEDNAVASKKLRRSKTGEFDRVLDEELRIAKKKLTCTVCDDREKDSIITRCYHVFCNECIRTNLQTRHRKCPACAKTFGESDVVPLYLS